MKRLLQFALFCAGVILLAATLLVWSGVSDRLGTADMGLVLGNTVDPDGSPSPRLKARLDRAVTLYRQGYFKLILVSGGTGKEGVPEGNAMKSYLAQNGVPGEAILVDNDGVDTYASARNAKRLLEERKLQSVFVVTQYFHVPRSRLALSKLGISTIYSAHAPYFEWRDLYSILRELPAYLKYFLRSPEVEAFQSPANAKSAEKTYPGESESAGRLVFSERNETAG